MRNRNEDRASSKYPNLRCPKIVMGVFKNDWPNKRKSSAFLYVNDRKRRSFSLRRLSKFKRKHFLYLFIAVCSMLAFIGLYTTKLRLPNVGKIFGLKRDGRLILTDSDFASKKDAPFNYGCNDVTQYKAHAEYRKQNAAFIMLTQNDELEDVVKTLESIELKFNQWFQYPYVFLNDKPFNEHFKETIQSYTNAKVEFGIIEPKDWDFPEYLDNSENKGNSIVDTYIKDQENRGVVYGGLKSYHKMCRFYSGFFYKHPLVAQYEWYWRLEPDVQFFCSTTYDPFYEMAKRNKKYGFTVMINEIYWTVPSLFRQTQNFLKHFKKTVDPDFKVGSAWSLFIDSFNYIDTTGDEEHQQFDIFINREHEVNLELSRYVEKDYFLKNHLASSSVPPKGNNKVAIDAGIRSVMYDARKIPPIFDDKFDNEEYTMCHFWSNFEIARVDTFNNPLYNAYFEYLEKQGGFFKERWGDAVVHSLGVAMLNLEDIHYFRDIGYQHSDLMHCPKNKAGSQFKNPNDALFEKNILPKHRSKNFLYKSLQQKMHDIFQVPDSDIGSGCNCECPLFKNDIEDLSAYCPERFFESMQDNPPPRHVPKSEELMHQVEKAYIEHILND